MILALCIILVFSLVINLLAIASAVDETRLHRIEIERHKTIAKDRLWFYTELLKSDKRWGKSLLEGMDLLDIRYPKDSYVKRARTLIEEWIATADEALEGYNNEKEEL